MKKSILRYLLSNKICIFISMIATFVCSILNVGIAYLFYAVINIAQNGKATDAILLTVFIIVYLLILGVLSFFDEMIKEKLIQGAMLKLKKDLLKGIMNQQYQEFTIYSFSEYQSIINNDLEMIENDLFNGVLSLLYYIVSFIISVASMIYLNFYVTVWVFIMTFIVIKLPSFLSKKLETEKNNMSKTNMKESITIKDILYSYSFSRNKSVRYNLFAKTFNILKRKNNQKIELAKTKSLISVISNSTAWITSCTTISICAYFVIIGQLSLASMIAFSNLMNNISYPLLNMSNIINGINSLKPIEKKLNKLLDVNINSNDVKIEFHKEIKCSNLEFSYGQKVVLNNLNLSFEKGKKYLIIGESGSGKSTLLKLIAHYLPCAKGKVEIDNIDLNFYSDSQLDSIIGYMSQDIYLINDTIRNNITLLNENYTDEEISNVINICGLRNLIDQLPNKENEIIKEDGNNFSGGEKQRIALARILIRKLPILLLDEFNASLDESNSKEIENIILSMQNITLLNVSHKINEDNLSKYDEVITM